MRVFVAEKPSVAAAIAGELGAVTGKGAGYIECGSDIVTWCFGHMFEQAEPDEYTRDDVPRGLNGKKVWRVEELPIIPVSWILKPKETAKKQLAVLDKLLNRADVVVNAGDPDREGQLLVDEVLEHFQLAKPVRRYWVSSLDSVSIKRGLAGLKDNSAYRGWADAARARQRADWLIGMNLSRAYTLRVQRGGSRELLPVGRVQTPTLALVVSRDLEIASFKPVPYHTIHCEVQHAGDSFSASWQAKADQEGLDAEGRLVNTAVADAIVQKIEGKSGFVSEYKQEAKKQNQPLSLSLSDLTLLASNKFGYGAEDVLNACQALYETHKLTTYPRTDCSYLPESQHADAPLVFAALKQVNPDLADIIEGADPWIMSKTWNDSKITAHHGIIPTMHAGCKAGLDEQERKIYELIVLAYIAQFYPVHAFMSTSIEMTVAGQTCIATGKVVTCNGWRELFQEDEDQADKNAQENLQKLPVLKQGDEVAFVRATRKDSKTKAPARFTEGTLNRAMENIYKFVADPAHKKMLRESDGIGTSATRASIISELKRRAFLEPKGKHIVSTPLGRGVIDVLPEVLKIPMLTALYERMLKTIELGKAELGAFLLKQEAFVRDQVARANSGSVTIAGGKPRVPISELHKCMVCGSGLSRRPGKKKKFWWGCSNFPGCKQTYPDVKGRPDYSRGHCSTESNERKN